MNEERQSERQPPPLAVTHPHLTEFAAFLPELNKETDRGMVLIATSFIDELMRRILLAFFVEGETSSSLVEGFNAPLGSLATRSAAAFALGLISEQELKEADTLRDSQPICSPCPRVVQQSKHFRSMQKAHNGSAGLQFCRKYAHRNRRCARPVLYGHRRLDTQPDEPALLRLAATSPVRQMALLSYPLNEIMAHSPISATDARRPRRRDEVSLDEVKRIVIS
jgi:hypothetical protein